MSTSSKLAKLALVGCVSAFSLQGQLFAGSNSAAPTEVISEEAFVKGLSPESKAIYEAMDAAGKEATRKLTQPSSCNSKNGCAHKGLTPEEAVKEAQKKVSNKPTSSNSHGNSKPTSYNPSGTPNNNTTNSSASRNNNPNDNTRPTSSTTAPTNSTKASGATSWNNSNNATTNTNSSRR